MVNVGDSYKTKSGYTWTATRAGEVPPAGSTKITTSSGSGSTSTAKPISTGTGTLTIIDTKTGKTVRYGKESNDNRVTTGSGSVVRVAPPTQEELAALPEATKQEIVDSYKQVNKRVLAQTLNQPTQVIQQGFMQVGGVSSDSLTAARIALAKPESQRTLSDLRSIVEASSVSGGYAQNVKSFDRVRQAVVTGFEKQPEPLYKRIADNAQAVKTKNFDSRIPIAPVIQEKEKGYQPNKLTTNYPLGEKQIEKDLFTQTYEGFKGIGQGAVELIPETITEMKLKTEQAFPSVKGKRLETALLSVPITLKTLAIDTPIQTIAYLGSGGIIEVPSKAYSLVDTPQKLGKMGIGLIIFKKTQKLSSKMLFGDGTLKKFGTVKGLIKEGKAGEITLTTSQVAKTGGIIGKKVQITSSVSLKPIELESVFGKSGFLKLKSGAINRVVLPEKAGINYLRIEAGKQVLLLPEKIAERALIRQETGLILSQAELIKFRPKIFGGGQGTINKLSPSIGEPFALSSEGIIRVRSVGFKERISSTIKPSKLDFVREIDLATKKGIKLGVAEDVKGLTVGLVESRKIVPSISGSKGTPNVNVKLQPKLDLRRLTAPLSKIVETSGLPIKLSGVGKQLSAKLVRLRQGNKVIVPPKVSLTGTKGKLIQIEYGKDSTTMSSPRQFKTQDLLVEFGKDNAFKASRLKIEDFPMEIKTLYKNVSKQISPKVTYGAGNKQRVALNQIQIEGAGNRTQIASPKKIYLPGDDFKPPTVSDATLSNIFKRMDSPKISKPGNLTNIGTSIVQQRGTVLAQKIVSSSGSVGLTTKSFTTNLSAGGTATLLQTKPKIKIDSKTKTSTTPETKIKISNVYSPKIGSIGKTSFGAFATTTTIQSQKIDSSAKLAQKIKTRFKDTTGQKQTQFVAQPQIVIPTVVPATAQASKQAQKQMVKQRLLEKTKFKPVQSFVPKNIVPKLRLPKVFDKNIVYPTRVFGSNLRKGYSVVSRVRGKKVVLAVGVPKNLAVAIGKSFTGKTTARSFTIKQVGLTDRQDVGLSDLFEYRQPKFGGKVAREGFTFVEKSMFAINTPGEVRGLKAGKFKSRLSSY